MIIIAKIKIIIVKNMTVIKNNQNKNDNNNINN